MKPMTSSPLIASLILGALTVTGSLAADWSQWRGPNRDDHSPDKGLLKKWPEGGPKRLWLFEGARLGYAGYSIVGNQLFTLGLRDNQEFLIAVDVTKGTELWATPFGAKYPNNWGDGPRGTPTVDEGLVYAISGQGNLICSKASDGKMVWQKSLATDLGGKLQNWGYTESPLIVGNKIICTPGGSKGTMAALDKKTGALIWQTSELTDQAQYSSPILITHAGKKQIVQLVEKKFFGVDPDKGKVLWKSDFPPGRVAVIPTPIYQDGLVYITAAYGAGCKAVKLEADGSATTVYENKVMKNHHGGVVLVDGNIYGHSEGYAWVCQNFKTGEEVWASKALGKGAVHYADGMLYCIDEGTGTVVLAEASPKGWTEHGRFKLDPQTKQRKPQGRIWTHPVVINGKLFLRDQELLFCFDVKGN